MINQSSTMRRQSLAVFGIALSAATAFTAPMPSFRPLSALRMVAEEVAEEIPIVLTGNNIELTGALESYVRSKLQRPLEKIASSGLMNGISCDVHLVVNKNPKVSRIVIAYVGFYRRSYQRQIGVNKRSVVGSHPGVIFSYFLCRSRMLIELRSLPTSRELLFDRPKIVRTCTPRLMQLPIVWYVLLTAMLSSR